MFKVYLFQEGGSILYRRELISLILSMPWLHIKHVKYNVTKSYLQPFLAYVWFTEYCVPGWM
jgi:hypothetical protein